MLHQVLSVGFGLVMVGLLVLICIPARRSLRGCFLIAVSRLCALVAVLVLVVVLSTPGLRLVRMVSSGVVHLAGRMVQAAALPAAPAPDLGSSVVGGPSLSAAFIDRVLS